MNASNNSAKQDVNIVITVNQPRAVVLPKTKSGSAYSKNVEFAQGKLLLPGENDLPQLYWNEVKTNPAVKIWLACGTIENKGAGKAKPIMGSLDGLKVAKAIELVEKCEDVAQLRTWMTNSKAISVKKAIEKQINLIIEMEDGEAGA